jgi:hypothetical protein
LVDVIAEEIAEDHPHLLMPGSLGESVREALTFRRGPIARSLEEWL